MALAGAAFCVPASGLVAQYSVRCGPATAVRAPYLLMEESSSDSTIHDSLMSKVRSSVLISYSYPRFSSPCHRDLLLTAIFVFVTSTTSHKA